MSPFNLRRWLQSAKNDVLSHVALDLWVALGMLLDGPHRTSSPTFDPAKAMFHTSYYPIRAWGAILLAITVAMIAGLIFGRQFPYEAASWAFRGYYGFWMGFFVIAGLNGDASPWSTGFGVMWFIRTIRLPLENPYLRLPTGQ